MKIQIFSVCVMCVAAIKVKANLGQLSRTNIANIMKYKYKSNANTNIFSVCTVCGGRQTQSKSGSSVQNRHRLRILHI